MSPTRKAVLAAAVLAASPVLAEEKAAALPKDYRSWTHVRSMVVTDPDHGMYGFQDLYGNRAAVEALRAGKPFKDGAVLVAVIHEPVTAEGMVRPGARRRTAVQMKDSRAKATSGWRYAVYDPAGKPVRIDPATCVGCHQAARDTDHVFARFSE